VRLQLQKSARIVGQVVDGAGQAVRSYTLTVVPPARGSESQTGRLFRAMEESGGPRQVNDPRGSFLVEDLVPGSYDLIATMADGRTAQTTGVAVTEGETRQGVRLALKEALVVSGRVVEYESGQPLAGARVSVRQPGMPREARTDASGTFSLEKVPALPSLTVGIDTDGRTHISEAVPVPAARDGRAEVGTIRLLKVDPANPMKGRIGVSYGEEDGKITINNVAPDSPAAKAGLKAKDVVLEVDGKKLLGTDIPTLGLAMRADPAKEITLVVQSPGGQPRTVKLKRGGM
jgi:membrane-associated protease RseP (regulator of RpoE activity)